MTQYPPGVSAPRRVPPPVPRNLKIPAKLDGHGSMDVVITALSPVAGIVSVDKEIPPGRLLRLTVRSVEGDAVEVWITSGAYRNGRLRFTPFGMGRGSRSVWQEWVKSQI